MSQLMIQAGAEKVTVPMKCDVAASFFWYGPEVSNIDDEQTLKQYNDYVNTGVYKDREEYK